MLRYLIRLSLQWLRRYARQDRRVTVLAVCIVGSLLASLSTIPLRGDRERQVQAVALLLRCPVLIWCVWTPGDGRCWKGGVFRPQPFPLGCKTRCLLGQGASDWRPRVALMCHKFCLSVCLSVRPSGWLTD
eukprot:1846373-Rhodomonas_salina.2